MQSATHKLNSNTSLREATGLALPWVLGLAVALPNLQGYIVWDFNLILALIALPFLLRFGAKSTRVILRFGLLSACFFLLHALMRIKLPFLFGMGAYFLFLLENQRGKVGWMPLWWIFLLSPVQNYFSLVAGSLLRLKLSAMAGTALDFMGMDVAVDGNRFTLGEGEIFYVDPACAGLGMLLTAWVFALIFMGFHQQQKSKSLSFFSGSIFMVVTVVLVLSANFFRILGVVLLRAEPETLLHELTGIAAFCIYCLIPMWLLAGFWVKQMGKDQAALEEKGWKPMNKVSWAIATVLLAGAGFLTMAQENFRNDFGGGGPVPWELPGFEKATGEDGVTRYLGENALIFIKPPAKFWGSDHNPGICWRGDGYLLRGESARKVCGQQINIAELKREEETLFTAWWYDNGAQQTASQWDWRWKSLQGAPGFYLVNVTVSDSEALTPAVENAMDLVRIARHPETSGGGYFCNLEP